MVPTPNQTLLQLPRCPLTVWKIQWYEFSFTAHGTHQENVWQQTLTSSYCPRPLTTTFGRNLSMVTGDGSSSLTATKDASFAIMYGEKFPNDTFQR